MRETTYVVTGFMRCGTSMMMKALEAGGLDAAFDPKRSFLNKKHGDEQYKPNAGGFYELGRREYQEPDFPRKYEGKLIKCLYGGLSKVAAGNYKLVWMHRDTEEIRQSYEAFFSSKHAGLKDFDAFKTRYETVRGIADMRQDMDVIDIWFRDVVADPGKVFTELKEFGFPIDVKEASAIVDPALYRFRLENLDVNI